MPLGTKHVGQTYLINRPKSAIAEDSLIVHSNFVLRKFSMGHATFSAALGFAKEDVKMFRLTI